MGVGLSISLGLVLGGGLLPVGALWWTGRWDGSSTPLILCLVAAGVLTLLGLWTVRPLPLYRTSEESRS